MFFANPEYAYSCTRDSRQRSSTLVIPSPNQLENQVGLASPAMGPARNVLYEYSIHLSPIGLFPRQQRIEIEAYPHDTTL